MSAQRPDGGSPGSEVGEPSGRTVWNASTWLVDRHLEAGRGEHLALDGPGGRRTYAELAGEVAVAGEVFRALGVRPEERVLLVMADGPTMVAALLGVMRIGAVPVPVSTMLRARELAGLVADSRARAVVVSAVFLEVVRGAIEELGGGEVDHLVVADDDRPSDLAGPVGTARPTNPAGPGGAARAADAERFAEPVEAIRGLRDVRTWRFAELSAGVTSVDPAYATWPDSPALWLYTSGTTGRPKAAMHRHEDLAATVATYAQAVLRVTAEDRFLSVAKLFFAYGFGNSLTFPLAAGATAILDPEPPSPDRVAALVRRERPTLFFAVPTFFGALLAANLPADSFASVRQGVSAGEPLPAGIWRRFRDAFGVEILDGIGSTEALHIFCSNRAGDVHPGTSGTPVPGWELQLRDDRGALVGPGGTGQLYVRGPAVATGYWCQAEATRRTFQGEWLRTGDVYALGDDGVYTYLSRSDDLLKSGGIWVSPAEVEAVLLEHPDVLEAAIVGLVDAEGILRVTACVVPRPGHGIEPGAVVEHCRAALAPYKRPRDVVVMASLPKTATGKIQRYRLRETLGGQHAARR